MSRRGVLVLMILTTVIALATLVQDYRFDGWIDAERASLVALASEAAANDSVRSDSLTAIPGNDNRTTVNNDAVKLAIERRIVQLSQLRFAMNGAGLIFVLAVAMYFGRVVTFTRSMGEPSTTQMLRDLPPPVKTGVSVAHAAAAAPAGPATSATSAPPVGPVGPIGAVGPFGPARSTLAAAAELCVDLGKVAEAGEVPALLERTATVLGARGLIVWAVDSDGARLHPSLSHGYSDKVLAKLRSIQVDSDNVTALAFRSAQPQNQNGAAAGDAAAIAIPLLTAGGCVGVLSAELRHNRPHADLVPMARILGAQFSTLIAPAEDAPRRTAQA